MVVDFALRVVYPTLLLSTALLEATVTTECFICCTVPRLCASVLWRLAGLHMAGLHMAGSHMAASHMAASHMAGLHMAGLHMAGLHMAASHLAASHMAALHMAGFHMARIGSSCCRLYSLKQYPELSHRLSKFM